MGNLRRLHLGELWRERIPGIEHQVSPLGQLIQLSPASKHGCGRSPRYLPSSSYAASSARYSEAIRKSAMWSHQRQSMEIAGLSVV